MINHCINNAKSENLDKICKFYNSDPFEYIETRTFGICIAMGLFDYIIEPLPVINRMKYFCNDRIILSFPKKGTLRSLIRKLRLGLKGCDGHYYYKDDFINLIKQAGFVKYDIAEYGHLYCITAYI